MAFVESELANPHSSIAGIGTTGGGAFLGVIPDYTTLEGNQGCGLSGVVPGSPAKACGLLADDLIIHWDDRPVANVRGLTERLHASRPGDEVELEVLRRGKRMTLMVTLGQRGGRKDGESNGKN